MARLGSALGATSAAAVSLATLGLVATFGCATEGRRLVGSRDAGQSAFDAARPDGGPHGETCYNGLDDNADGLIDERCPCVGGERQSCWPGSGSRRAVGACRDGVQTCEPFGEFDAWGDCVGPVLPGVEIPSNGIDEDCDGTDQGGGSCRARETDGGGCGDGVDGDCDGRVDCADPDCGPTEECSSSCDAAESAGQCDDGIDNDCDGRVDCLDPDCDLLDPCQTPPPPPPGCVPEFPFFAELLCGDGRDNDCSGGADCLDSDCRRPGSCGCATQESACADGMDDDCDADADCADIDCQSCVEGSVRFCAESGDSHWGEQRCSGGRWGGCGSTFERPGGCGGDLYSTSCCISAGACCENYPTDGASVGDCPGLTCRP